MEHTIWKVKCSLQTCSNTAGFHLTSCSGIFAQEAIQAIEKSGPGQTGAQGGSPTKYPRARDPSFLVKLDTAPILTVSFPLMAPGRRLASTGIHNRTKTSLGVKFNP